MHWARLEASALGSLIAACPAWKRRKEKKRRRNNEKVKSHDAPKNVTIQRGERYGEIEYIIGVIKFYNHGVVQAVIGICA